MNYLDLFAGAGGLSEGFAATGFQPIAHVEMDIAACFTLKTRIAYYHLKETGQLDRYVAYLKGEINREKLYSLVPKDKLDTVINLTIGKANNTQIFKLIGKKLNNENLDLIIGGPPCQAYSLVGRARSEDAMKSDSRNFLFLEYARYIQRFKPKMFVFENVSGLRSANKGAYFRRMLLTFRNINGYNVKEYEVTASDFNILQGRKRIILIGGQKDLKLDFPHFEKVSNSFTVGNLLYDLPTLQAGEGVDKYMEYAGPTNGYLQIAGIRDNIEVLTQHICRPNSEQDREIYRIAVEKWNVHKERLNYNDLPERLKTHLNRMSFCDRFKVVASDLNSAQTITAHISKDGHYYIHPDMNQNRSITVREAARLQSFPDDFYFEGEKEGHNRTAAYKQIGNAVPPLLAKRIAEEIKKCL